MIIPMPNKNEKVFEIDLGESSNAVINHPEWWLISRGYRLLAQIGTKYVIDKNSEQDYLIYPIIFLYRHFF